MTRFCPSCGLEQSDPSQAECNRCGAVLPPIGATPPAPPPGAVSPSIGLPQEVRNWAMLTHLSALSALVVGIGFILGPLIIWLIKRDTHPFIDRNGKEALNFNISVLIYGIVSAILIIVLVGVLLLAALAIFWLVVTIIATVRAANGEEYRYPMAIRFIS